ncbi:helix-turn-helix domain-containing protein [Rothia uropygioeca]|uniref:helix-turn-helix domain-containing protein n=1 Tax=Kocuria sp. 257 TaxID=2021970 RepID=UPI00192D7B63|nr:helix-turn-helix domain-containing protein [Kocuria sp. 257]
MSVRGLAKKYGVHRATVSAHLSRRNTPRRRPGLDVDERAEAVRLFRAGVSMRAISRRLGVSRTPVRACLVEVGLIVDDASGSTTISQHADTDLDLVATS